MLFSGLLFGHFGATIAPPVHEFARDFGLILFVHAIGIGVGPGFARSLRRHGLPLNLIAAGTVILGAATAVSYPFGLLRVICAQLIVLLFMR